MAFLKPKSTISLTVPATAEEAVIIEEALKTIVSKCSAKELQLLAKAISNPLIKTAALSKLKESFSNS